MRLHIRDKLKNKTAKNDEHIGKERVPMKGKRFLELKSSIMIRLDNVHKLLKDQLGPKCVADIHPNERTASQTQIWKDICKISEDLKEMNALYEAELRKRKSRYTEEELAYQKDWIVRLEKEIEHVKEVRSGGFTRAESVALNIEALQSLDAVTPSTTAGIGSSDATLSDQQRMELRKIEKRDESFDKRLDRIGEGIQVLNNIAEMQGEEAEFQNRVLDDIDVRIEEKHRHMADVNKFLGKLNRKLRR